MAPGDGRAEAGPRNPIEAGLGFRIEIYRNDTGSVVFFPNPPTRHETAVRPATPVEIAMWKVLLVATARPPYGVPATDAIDPFGTPKPKERDDGN